jgi:hypothetical protein
MTPRTFKQLGWAFGTEQLFLIAALDNVEIFDGPVPTGINEPEPDPNTPELTWPYGDELFTWTEDIEYVGSKEMRIQVIGTGNLYLTLTLADYGSIIVSTDPYTISIPAGPDVFDNFYHQQFDGYIISDPYTNVAIGGTPCYAAAEQRGQWMWIIPGGSEFVATLNVGAARLPGT